MNVRTSGPFPDSVFTHLVVVHELVPLGLTLVGADEEHQPVSVEELLGHVRAEVAASAPEGVGTTARVRVGVTPQQVQHLWVMGMDAEGSCLKGWVKG